MVKDLTFFYLRFIRKFFRFRQALSVVPIIDLWMPALNKTSLILCSRHWLKSILFLWTFSHELNLIQGPHILEGKVLYSWAVLFILGKTLPKKLAVKKLASKKLWKQNFWKSGCKWGRKQLTKIWFEKRPRKFLIK